MEQIYIRKRQACWIFMLLILCVFWFAGLALADQEKPSCPDQNTLSNSARQALASAQKQMEEKHGNQAQKILEDFLASHPKENHPYITFTLGAIYLESDSLRKSRDMFAQSTEQCPVFSGAWQNLGKVCYDLKEYSRAAQAFDTVYELEGKPRFRFHAAVAWMEAKKKTRAFEHMLFLTNGSAGPPKKEWVEFMTHLALELKRSGEAIPVLESLLAKENPPAYLFKLAVSVYLEQNSYRKATQALCAYSMMEKMNPREMRLLGDLLYSQGVPMKAAIWYEKVNQVKPCLRNCVRLVSALHEGFASEKAIQTADKGLQRYPESVQLWRLKAWACYGEKRFQEASHCFSKVVGLNKKDGKSLFMSGLSAYRAGEKKKAKAVLKLAAAHKSYKNQANALIRQINYEISQADNT